MSFFGWGLAFGHTVKTVVASAYFNFITSDSDSFITSDSDTFQVRE